MALRKRTFMSYDGKNKSNKTYEVSITKPGMQTVKGISKNPFNFKLGAKWADLFQGLVPGAELLMKTGNASLTTGIFSQKYFQGGNNLDMTVEFRIHDEGISSINPVIRSAKALSNLAVSEYINPQKTLEQFKGETGETIDDISDVLKKALELKFSEAGTQVVNILNKYISAINNRAVTLSISDYFVCRRMAIQDVNVTYSPSHTNSGPLFGDFSVTLISLQAITRGGGEYGINEILTHPNADRITINGSSLKDKYTIGEEPAGGGGER